MILHAEPNLILALIRQVGFTGAAQAKFFVAHLFYSFFHPLSSIFWLCYVHDPQ
jgi:hypothetical protein